MASKLAQKRTKNRIANVTWVTSTCEKSNVWVTPSLCSVWLGAALIWLASMLKLKRSLSSTLWYTLNRCVFRWHALGAKLILSCDTYISVAHAVNHVNGLKGCSFCRSSFLFSAPNCLSLALHFHWIFAMSSPLITNGQTSLALANEVIDSFHEWTHGYQFNSMTLLNVKSYIIEWRCNRLFSPIT